MTKLFPTMSWNETKRNLGSENFYLLNFGYIIMPANKVRNKYIVITQKEKNWTVSSTDFISNNLTVDLLFTVWCNNESESCSVLSDSLRPHRLYSHGILQARILEWILEYTGAFPFPRGSSQPRDRTQVSPTLQVDSLPAEPQGKPKNTGVGNLSLLQRIFPTEKLNRSLLHCRQILYQLSYQGTPNVVFSANNCPETGLRIHHPKVMCHIVQKCHIEYFELKEFKKQVVLLSCCWGMKPSCVWSSSYTDERGILISKTPGESEQMGLAVSPNLLHLVHTLSVPSNFLKTALFIKTSIKTLRFNCFLRPSFSYEVSQVM